MENAPLPARRFKADLKERCFTFSMHVIRLVDTFPNKKSAHIIADQLIRSATSVGANLTEARASSSRREFKKFNEISLKSANETRYWLDLARNTDLAEKERIDMLLQEAGELANMIAAGVIRLKNTI